MNSCELENIDDSARKDAGTLRDWAIYMGLLVAFNLVDSHMPSRILKFSSLVAIQIPAYFLTIKPKLKFVPFMGIASALAVGYVYIDKIWGTIRHVL